MTLDPIAATTLWLLIGFFAAAGVAVFAYERIKKVKDDNLRRRYYSWYIIAPVVLIPAYFGGLPFAILITVLALYSLHEFFSVAHVRDIRPYRWTGRIFSVLLVWTAIFNARNVPEPFASMMPAWQATFGAEPLFSVPLFYVLPVFLIMWVLTVPVLMGTFEGMLTKQCVTIFGVLYFGWFLGHIVFLRHLQDGFGFVIFLSVAVVLNDVMAYVFGRLFGKHKMTPNISPKKTWEGAIGGLIGSLIAVAVFHYATPSLSWVKTIVAGLVIGIAAPIGDLVVSVIKRDMAVKDSGNLIPGHGGLLDRCDSLLFATPAFYYYLLLVRNLHI